MAQVAKTSDISLSVTATLPPQLTVRLLSDIDATAVRMARRIVDGIALPDERFRRLSYLRTVTVACRDAFRTLVRLLHDGRGLRPGDLERLGSMGAQQAELGVPLEVLLGAYRLAAKIVWQEVIGEPALLNEVAPATVVAVTGRVLEYFDEISAAVGAAYLETRERLMRQRDRERDRVLQRLVAGDTSPELHSLAAAADIHLAPPYRVVAYAAANPEAELQLDEMWHGAGALLVSDQPGTWIALVRADCDLAALCGGIENASFGLGPTAATLEEIAPSARQARRALDVGLKLMPDRRMHDDADVGVFAALASDRHAMESFIGRVLGPLSEQRTPRKQEMLATLEALLDTPSIAEAAFALGVHRHTVVYRVQRLHQLGIDVEEPDQRHHIWLALRCMRLLGSV